MIKKFTPNTNQSANPEDESDLGFEEMEGELSSDFSQGISPLVATPSPDAHARTSFAADPMSAGNYSLSVYPPSASMQATSHRPSATHIDMKKNILANDVEIKGTIKFDDELIFDGRLEGEVLSEGTLILGENSEIQGEVKTKAVSLSGRVQGNITVEEKCELKGRAQLIGDLKAARLVIEEGATFVGRSEVTPNKVNMPLTSLRGEEQSRSAVRA